MRPLIVEVRGRPSALSADPTDVGRTKCFDAWPSRAQHRKDACPCASSPARTPRPPASFCTLKTPPHGRAQRTAAASLRHSRSAPLRTFYRPWLARRRRPFAVRAYASWRVDGTRRPLQRLRDRAALIGLSPPVMRIVRSLVMAETSSNLGVSPVIACCVPLSAHNLPLAQGSGGPKRKRWTGEMSGHKARPAPEFC